MSLETWPTRFVAKRALFNFLGTRFRIFSDGALQFFVLQRAFKFKETIIVYADAARTTERLHIQARNIIDFSATYDVTDPVTGERVGGLVRKGFRSMFRDTWSILSAGDDVIGTVQEDRGILAFIRRLFPLIPQTFHIRVHDQLVGHIRQRFNPFQLVYDVDVQEAGIDPRMGVATSVLLLAIEQRQG